MSDAWCEDAKSRCAGSRWACLAQRFSKSRGSQQCPFRSMIGRMEEIDNAWVGEVNANCFGLANGCSGTVGTAQKYSFADRGRTGRADVSAMDANLGICRWRVGGVYTSGCEAPGSRKRLEIPM